MKRRIHVSEVSPGIFSNERFVQFEAEGKPYGLFVDQASLKDNTLEVQIVGMEGETALVELPRDTLNAGSRVRIPMAELLPV